MRIRIAIDDIPEDFDTEALEHIVARQLREWRAWITGLRSPTIMGPSNHEDATRGTRWIRGEA